MRVNEYIDNNENRNQLPRLLRNDSNKQASPFAMP